MDFQYSDIVEKRDLLSEEFAGGYVIVWLTFVGVLRRSEETLEIRDIGRMGAGNDEA